MLFLITSAIVSQVYIQHPWDDVRTYPNRILRLELIRNLPPYIWTVKAAWFFTSIKANSHLGIKHPFTTFYTYTWYHIMKKISIVYLIFLNFIHNMTCAVNSICVFVKYTLKYTRHFSFWAPYDRFFAINRLFFRSKCQFARFLFVELSTCLSNSWQNIKSTLYMVAETLIHIVKYILYII